MSKMTKDTAKKVLTALDSAANELQRLKVAGFLDAATVDGMLLDLDTSADRIQLAAFGPESFEAYKAKVAKVFKQDPDEPYMKTFENPQKPIKTESDEPYMKKAPAGFQPGTGGDTFDSDDTMQVTDRKEYTVRDESEYSDGTKKQPSWKGGPAGKSTKQGSAAPAPRRASSEKTWAP